MDRCLTVYPPGRQVQNLPRRQVLVCKEQIEKPRTIGEAPRAPYASLEKAVLLIESRGRADHRAVWVQVEHL